MTRESEEPVTRIDESYWRQRTEPSWPVRVWMVVPEAMSQMRIVWSRCVNVKLESALGGTEKREGRSPNQR